MAMKKVYKIIISLIIIMLLIITVSKFETEQIISLIMFLIFLPLLAFEFLIPSGLLKKIIEEIKIPWYSNFLYYTLIFPFINFSIIFTLNGIFKFYPNLPLASSGGFVLNKCDNINIVIIFNMLIYLTLISSGLIVRKKLNKD